MSRTSIPAPFTPAISACRTPSIRARIACSSLSSMLLVSPRSIQASYPPSPSSPFCIAASRRSAASDSEPFRSRRLLASFSRDKPEDAWFKCLFSCSADCSITPMSQCDLLTENIFSQGRISMFVEPRVVCSIAEVTQAVLPCVLHCTTISKFQLITLCCHKLVKLGLPLG